MRRIVDDHRAAMDEFDPERRVKPGSWTSGAAGIMEGTGPSKGKNLFEQQSNLRDAVVAALTLNLFNNRCDVVGMSQRGAAVQQPALRCTWPQANISSRPPPTSSTTCSRRIRARASSRRWSTAAAQAPTTEKRRFARSPRPPRRHRTAPSLSPSPTCPSPTPQTCGWTRWAAR